MDEYLRCAHGKHKGEICADAAVCDCGHVCTDHQFYQDATDYSMQYCTVGRCDCKVWNPHSSETGHG